MFFWVVFGLLLSLLFYPTNNMSASPTSSEGSVRDELPSIPGCDTIIDLLYVLQV